MLSTMARIRFFCSMTVLVSAGLVSAGFHDRLMPGRSAERAGEVVMAVPASAVAGCRTFAPFHRFGNRVVAAAAPGMAARKARQGEPGAADQAMSLQGFHGIGGAAWVIAASGRQQGRNRHLVDADRQDGGAAQ